MSKPGNAADGDLHDWRCQDKTNEGESKEDSKVWSPDHIVTCEMCERGIQSPAVKFCPTCKVLYCTDCLDSFHPNRGPLVHHNLLPVDDYKRQLEQKEKATITETDLRITELPKDIHLRRFLFEISEKLKPEDFKFLKFIMKGEGGIARADIYGCEDVLDIFELLEKHFFLSMNNIVVLQRLIWFTRRDDLYDKMMDFACQHKDIIHMCSPPELKNGYENVKIHVKAEISRELVEQIRSAAARWLCIPDRFIIVSGLEETESWLITLMIPTIATNRLKEVFSLHGVWLIQRDIDYIEFCGVVLHFTDAEFAEEPDIKQTLVIVCGNCSDIMIQEGSIGNMCSNCGFPLDGEFKYLVENRRCEVSVMKMIQKATETLHQIKEDIGQIEVPGFQYLMIGCLQRVNSIDDSGSVLETFNRLKDAADLSQNNILLLQELVWFTGRERLYEQMVNLSILSKGVTRFDPVRIQIDPECAKVRISFTDDLTKDKIEDLRAAFSRWLCIPIYAVKTHVKLFWPSNEIILEIPKISAQNLSKVLEHHPAWLKELHVRYLSANNKILYGKEYLSDSDYSSGISAKMSPIVPIYTLEYFQKSLQHCCLLDKDIAGPAFINGSSSGSDYSDDDEDGKFGLPRFSDSDDAEEGKFQ